MNEEWRVIKSKISINVEDGFLFCGGWIFFKSVSVDSAFVRDMRVPKTRIQTCQTSQKTSID